MKFEPAMQGAALVAAAVFGIVLGSTWDGQVSAAGEAAAWNGLPPAVKAAFEKERPGEAPTEIEEETHGGKTTYEAEYRSAKGNQDITVGADGTLIVVKTKIKAKDLPEAITKAIAAKYPGAKVRGAESTNLGTYELDLSVDGKKVEVVAKSDGTLGPNPEDDDADDEHEDDDDEAPADE